MYDNKISTATLGGHGIGNYYYYILTTYDKNH